VCLPILTCFGLTYHLDAHPIWPTILRLGRASFRLRFTLCAACSCRRGTSGSFQESLHRAFGLPSVAVGEWSAIRDRYPKVIQGVVFLLTAKREIILLDSQAPLSCEDFKGGTVIC
jgi:hypothetical protein